MHKNPNDLFNLKITKTGIEFKGTIAQSKENVQTFKKNYKNESENACLTWITNPTTTNIYIAYIVISDGGINMQNCEYTILSI